MNCLSEAQFAQIWQTRGGVKAWMEQSLQEQGSTATATVAFTFGNGQSERDHRGVVEEFTVFLQIA
jgi:hypothetical protein